MADRLNFNEMFLNRAEAEEIIKSTADPEIKVLLEMAQHQAYRVVLFPDNRVTDEERLKQLPTVPFDMLFYMQSVKRLLEFKHIVREVLSGNLDAAEMM